MVAGSQPACSFPSCHDVPYADPVRLPCFLGTLQVRELLGEAGVDHRLEAAVVELAKRVTSLLKSLQPAEVAKSAAKGFLKDLSFTATV